MRLFKKHILRYLIYLLWALIIVAIEYFFLEKPISIPCLILLFITNVAVLFAVEAYISRFLYKNYSWWDWNGGFLDQQITCRCDTCIEWRKKNWMAILKFRTIISLFLILPTITIALRSQIETAEKERLTLTSEVAAFQKENIQEEVKLYFDSLKKADEIPKSLYPEFNLSIIEGKTNDTIIIDYGYRLEGELKDFKEGRYMWSESVAASAWIHSFEGMLNEFLCHNIERADEVHLKLIGHADGIPVEGHIPYKGEFGNFPRTIIDESTTFYILDGKPKKITLREQQSIGNPEIAFLRAYGLREYLDTYVNPLINVKKKYAYYAYTQEDESIRGGQYRKVKVILSLNNVPKIAQKKESQKKLETFGTISLLITLLLIPFFIGVAVSYYIKWRDAEKEERHRIAYRNLCFFYLLVAIIITIVFAPLIGAQEIFS